jgi:hypothetical protein
MTLLPASVFGVSRRLPFDLSSKGDPASSYATAAIALRVPGVLKPPHHDKVEPPTRRILRLYVNNKLQWIWKKAVYHNRKKYRGISVE